MNLFVFNCSRFSRWQALSFISFTIKGIDKKRHFVFFAVYQYIYELYRDSVDEIREL